MPKTTPPPPKTLEVPCPECGYEGLDVLRGKVVRGGLGVEGTFHCPECGHTEATLIAMARPLHIPLIISYDDESAPAQVEVPEGEVLEIGDEFMVDEERVELTSIELHDQDRRTRRARAEEIKTLWGKSIDRVKVKFGLNDERETLAFETWFDPEDEVHVGQAFEIGEQGEETVYVDRVVTTEGKRLRGSFNVRDIKRVWLRRPGQTFRRDERRQREDEADAAEAAGAQRGGARGQRDPRGAPPRGQRDQRRAARQRDRRPGPRTGAPRRSGGAGAPGPSRRAGSYGGASGAPGAQRQSGDRDDPRGMGGDGPRDRSERPSRPSGGAGRPSGGRPSGGRPSGGRPSGGRPSGGRPSGGRPSGGRPSGGRPSGGRPSGGGRGRSGGGGGARRGSGGSSGGSRGSKGRR